MRKKERRRLEEMRGEEWEGMKGKRKDIRKRRGGHKQKNKSGEREAQTERKQRGNERSE